MKQCYVCKCRLNACIIEVMICNICLICISIRTMLLSAKFVVNLFFFVNEKYLYKSIKISFKEDVDGCVYSFFHSKKM